MLRNLSSSYDRMGQYQDQLATGKKINRPSDDPVIAMKGVSYRTNLMEVEQFKRNFGEAYNWVENTDSALDKATEALQRMRELVVQASNDTYEDSQRESVMQEVRQLKEHLVEISNSKFGEKFIFNGTDTLNKPVDLNAVKPVSDNINPVKIELSKGIYVQVNVNPKEIFSFEKDPTDPTDISKQSGLFGDINRLEDALMNGAGKEITEFLDTMDSHIKNVTNARAELGARINRIELMEERVGQQEVVATRVLSDNEDADIERVITDLKTQESVHRAALGVGSRIIQPTLMDFLR